MARILFVSDHPDSCEPLRLLLTRDGHDARCILAGGAIRAIRRIKPDLLLLELLLPDLDGLQLLEQIRQNPHLQHLPVLVLSDSFDAHAQTQARNLGALDYLLKESDLKDLLSRIRGHLPKP